MPQSGTKPKSFWCTEQSSNQLSHTTQGSIVILLIFILANVFTSYNKPLNLCCTFINLQGKKYTGRLNVFSTQILQFTQYFGKYCKLHCNTQLNQTICGIVIQNLTVTPMKIYNSVKILNYYISDLPKLWKSLKNQILIFQRSLGNLNFEIAKLFLQLF